LKAFAPNKPVRTKLIDSFAVNSDGADFDRFLCLAATRKFLVARFSAMQTKCTGL
jgi:hypothetical protein